MKYIWGKHAIFNLVTERLETLEGNKKVHSCNFSLTALYVLWKQNAAPINHTVIYHIFSKSDWMSPPYEIKRDMQSLPRNVIIWMPDTRHTETRNADTIIPKDLLPLDRAKQCPWVTGELVAMKWEGQRLECHWWKTQSKTDRIQPTAYTVAVMMVNISLPPLHIIVQLSCYVWFGYLLLWSICQLFCRQNH